MLSRPSSLPFGTTSVRGTPLTRSLPIYVGDAAQPCRHMLRAVSGHRSTTVHPLHLPFTFIHSLYFYSLLLRSWPRSNTKQTSSLSISTPLPCASRARSRMQLQVQGEKAIAIVSVGYCLSYRRDEERRKKKKKKSGGSRSLRHSGAARNESHHRICIAEGALVRASVLRAHGSDEVLGILIRLAQIRREHQEAA